MVPPSPVAVVAAGGGGFSHGGCCDTPGAGAGGRGVLSCVAAHAGIACRITMRFKPAPPLLSNMDCRPRRTGAFLKPRAQPAGDAPSWWNAGEAYRGTLLRRSPHHATRGSESRFHRPQSQPPSGCTPLENGWDCLFFDFPRCLCDGTRPDADGYSAPSNGDTNLDRMQLPEGNVESCNA